MPTDQPVERDRMVGDVRRRFANRGRGVWRPPASITLPVVRQRIRAGALARMHARFVRTHQRNERATHGALRPFYRDMTSAVVAAVRGARSMPERVAEIFDPDAFLDSFNGAMLPRWHRATWDGIAIEADWITAAGIATDDDEGSDATQSLIDDPAPPPSIHVEMTPELRDRISEWLRTRSVGVWNQVESTVSRTLQRQLTKALADGLTLNELADNIATKLGGLERWQGKRIARTETTGSMNNGSQIERDAVGIDAKSWLSTVDAVTRSDGAYDHVAPNGQVRPNKQTFSVSGEQLMYPGDGAGSAGNVINCRCAALAHFEE